METKVYCGYIKDIETVKKAASGGLATAMTEKFISNGNVVYGVSYTSDFKGAEYIRVSTFDGVGKLRSSKYIKALLKKEVLDLIIKDLDDGKKVLFIGLSCDVNVVKEYIRKKEKTEENILFVDLICHGATSPKVAEQYIEALEKKYKSKIVDFSVRYKNPYWTPPYLLARFRNKKEHLEVFYQTSYGIAFSVMKGEACYSCRFKSNYQSDITIGDYWGATEADAGFNKYGTSVAFVYTEKGDAFMNSLNNFELHIAEFEKATKSNPRYLSPIEKTNKMIAFKKNFNDRGLSYAIKKHLTIKQKILKMLPRFLVSLIKNR